MAEFECTHGMPSPKSCIDCMEEGPVAPPATWAKVGRPFPARFTSTCIGCDRTTIAVGDLLQRWDKGTDRTEYLHADCRPFEARR